MLDAQPQPGDGSGPASPSASPPSPSVARNGAGRPLYHFYHVQKCAGTTLIGHLAEQMPERLLQPQVRRGFLKEFGGGVADLRRLPAERNHIDVVAGHTASASVARAFAGREIRPLTMLRDPVGFIVSIYNFRERTSAAMGLKPVSFDHFHRTLAKNPISRLLLLRYLGIGYPLILALNSRKRLEIVEEALRSFWFVGSYEHADLLTAELSRRLGIAPVAARRNASPEGSLAPDELPEAVVAEIRAENALDQLLFERWRDALWSGRPAPVERPLAAWDQLSYLGNDAGRHVWWRVVQAERRLGRRFSAGQSTE
jgi:hypothetical protein